ncbi:MAG TPA: hypothetical protein VII02_07830, partial [Gemmatimonadaceae bacterium]
MGGAAATASGALVPLTVADTLAPLLKVAVMVVAPAAFTDIQAEASPAPSVARVQSCVLQGSRRTLALGDWKRTDAPLTVVTP